MFCELAPTWNATDKQAIPNVLFKRMLIRSVLLLVSCFSQPPPDACFRRGSDTNNPNPILTRIDWILGAITFSFLLLSRGLRPPATYVIACRYVSGSTFIRPANYTTPPFFTRHTISDGPLNQDLQHLYREIFLFFSIDRLCRKVSVNQNRTSKINIICTESFHKFSRKWDGKILRIEKKREEKTQRSRRWRRLVCG